MNPKEGRSKVGSEDGLGGVPNSEAFLAATIANGKRYYPGHIKTLLVILVDVCKS